MKWLLALAAILTAGMASAFEAGTLGSDYRDTGYVQGCTDTGELPGCTIITGGSQFVVAADGPSDAAALEQLRALPKLAWVAFRGDILNVYDSYADLALAFIAPAPEVDPYADLVQAVQGRWASTDDPLASLVVDGMIWTDFYDGQEVARSVISFSDSCSDGPIGERMLELFSIGSADPVSLCYAVEGVDADRMELTYTARGNTLVFGRPD